MLLVGALGSGKTSALRELHAERGWPLINPSLALSDSARVRIVIEKGD